MNPNSYAALFREEPNAESTLDEIRKHSPLLVFTVFHAVALIPFIQSYGTVAFLLCPMRTWALVMALHLIRKAGRLRKEHLKLVIISSPSFLLRFNFFFIHWQLRGRRLDVGGSIQPGQRDSLNSFVISRVTLFICFSSVN